MLEGSAKYSGPIAIQRVRRSGSRELALVNRQMGGLSAREVGVN